MNIYSTHRASLWLCLALGGALPALAAAQETGRGTAREARIVVVNVERLLSESPRAQAVTAGIDAEFAPRRQQIQAEVRRMRELSDKLGQDTHNLSDREHLARSREIGDLERAVRRDQAILQEDLFERKMQERSRMAERINEIIALLRVRQGIDLVLTRTIWHRPAIDITDKVAQELEK